MIGNMSNLDVFASFRRRLEHVCIITQVDLHTDAICHREGLNLHVVAVDPALSHRGEMPVKNAITLSGRGHVDLALTPSRRPLRVSSLAPARMDFDEPFVEVGVLTHVLDDTRPDLVVSILVPVDLIGECVEQAVSCRTRPISIYPTPGRTALTVTTNLDSLEAH